MKKFILSLLSQTLLSPQSNQFHFLATCIETTSLLTLSPPPQRRNANPTKATLQILPVSKHNIPSTCQSQSSLWRQPGKLHAYSWLTFQESFTVSFKCHRTLKPCIYEFLLVREWCSLFRIMFYHNALLLSSCCASSNTYIGRESALAFPPPAFSHSCMLLTFFFSFFFVCWFGRGFFASFRESQDGRKVQPFMRRCLKLASVPRGVAGWDARSCPQPAPAARAPLLQCRLALHSAPTFHAEIGTMQAAR